MRLGLGWEEEQRIACARLSAAGAGAEFTAPAASTREGNRC